MILRITAVACFTVLLSLPVVSPAQAQPSVRQALSLVPMQADVEIDRPTDEQIPKCTISPSRDADQRAWVVSSPEGNLLRRFVDTNGDNRIDQWCYYRGGIEVYRDIDGDFNEKADQYRWFGTGGMRWGLDRNEDGVIDDWKWISPEEVSAELLGAIRSKDARRFAALLVSKEELTNLGFEDEAAAQILTRVEKAKSSFATFAAEKKEITEQTRWIDFSAPTPGVVPAGTQSTKDLVVYENVMAMTETGGQHGELNIGTLLRVDDRWRLIDLPTAESAGVFFTAVAPRPTAMLEGSEGVSPQLQKLIQQLEELDKGLAAAENNEALIRRIHTQRTELLRQLVQVTSGSDRDMWLLQLVDSAVASTQSTEGTTDSETLTKLVTEVKASTENKEIISQARFVALTAEYSASLLEPNADYAAIQTKWISDLEAFVQEFGETRAAADAMLQLAISHEFAGQDEKAISSYERIVQEFPETEMAEKAKGATRRLQSVGKPLELSGKGLDGRPFDLGSLRGNLIVVQYWATWCEPCKEDMKQLRTLLSQYARRKFAVVGVNLDNQPQEALSHLRSERMGWPQLYESGGLESGLAKQMGIFTLPVMLLIDESGAVVNRSVTIEELDAELKKRFSSGN